MFYYKPEASNNELEFYLDDDLLGKTERQHFEFSILGGTEIDIDEAPYQINYGDICGGALIHQKVALTAAHCGKEYYIRVGNTGRLSGPKIKIQKHIVHPKFGKDHGFDYDLQLLELFRALRISDYVRPIELSDGNYIEYIYLAGWGFPAEKSAYRDKLQQVKLRIIPFKRCQAVQQSWYNNTLTSRMFCAGGRKEHDACQGDSGGAAVSLGKLVGISSFGYGCGRDFPGVYINVTETTVRKWINKHTGV